MSINLFSFIGSKNIQNNKVLLYLGPRGPGGWGDESKIVPNPPRVSLEGVGIRKTAEKGVFPDPLSRYRVNIFRRFFCPPPSLFVQ